MILCCVTESPWEQTCHAFHDVESNIEIFRLLSMKARSVTVKKPGPSLRSKAETVRAKGESRDTVQSLVRALGLLNALAGRDRGLGLSEVAKEVGLAISTAHRLLTTLQQEGYAHYDEERGGWHIGVQAFVVGSAFLRSRELTAIARPVMRELMERSGETVNLAVEDRGEAIYVAQVECRKMMRAIARPGGRTLMHASGVGKALLAAMASEEMERIASGGLPRETAKTIGTLNALRQELTEVRRRGYAVDDEENAIGLRCVAAAIYDEHARPFAALSLSGPTARIEDKMIEPLGNAIRDAADSITKALGGRNPTPFRH
jgi:IclR family transcriptional regulator, acetate operon repressor